MNNLVFRQRLLHVIDTVCDIENVKNDGVKRVHLQVEAKRVQRIMTQRGPGFKRPYHVHHAAGQRQQAAQCQQRVAGRVVAVHIRGYCSGKLMPQAIADGQPDDEELTIHRVTGGVADDILLFIQPEQRPDAAGDKGQ